MSEVAFLPPGVVAGVHGRGALDEVLGRPRLRRDDGLERLAGPFYVLLLFLWHILIGGRHRVGRVLGDDHPRARSRLYRGDTRHAAVEGGCLVAVGVPACFHVIAQLTPDIDVALHRVARCIHNRPLGLSIPARPPEEALQPGVVAAHHSTHAVPEETHVRVVESLGRVEHVLEQDEGVGLRRLPQEDVDVCEVLRTLGAGVISATRLGRGGVPRDHLGVREPFAELRLHVGSLALTRTQDVPQRLLVGVHGPRQLGHRLRRGADIAEVLQGADALLLPERPDRLVGGSGVEADRPAGDVAALHGEDLGGVRGGDGEDADVAGDPLGGRDQLTQGGVDQDVHPVARRGGDLGLVQDDEDVPEPIRTRQLVELGLDLLQPPVVVDVGAYSGREALAGLLPPGVVRHPREYEDALGVDAEGVVVLDDEADEGIDDPALTALHLGGEVDPRAEDGVAEHPAEDLERSQHLRDVGLLLALVVVGALFPYFTAGSPEAGVEVGGLGVALPQGD